MSAPATWSVGVAVVRPDEAVAGAWVLDAMTSAIVEQGWARGPGLYRLVLGLVSPGDVPRHIDVPISLDGSEAVVLIGITDRARAATVTIRLLEEAPGLELVQRRGLELEFDLHNGGARAVTGMGFPAGWFGGRLVEISPVPRVREEPVSYCGTGAVPLPALAPGDTTVSSRSPWAMGRDQIPSPGEHLWIVELETEGAGELEWIREDPDPDVVVVRGHAAMVRFVVP